MGFAMVVIIISIGLLFVIGFFVLKTVNDSKRLYVDQEIVQRLNSAMLDVTTECRSNTVKDLLIDCAESDSTICQDSVTGRATGTCAYVRNFVPQLLSPTLVEWGFRYEYKVYIDRANPFVGIKDDTDCLVVGRDVAPYFLQTDAGTLNIDLSVLTCKR
ncbi:MAG TPA: hypothetical protein VK158_05510 [Acidobacteriota bacterium]|nr:hypothetical protein [Acidobacteriota bacterium]